MKVRMYLWNVVSIKNAPIQLDLKIGESVAKEFMIWITVAFLVIWVIMDNRPKRKP